jgi:predicted PolB exonuclease-like 3'-5' exonuclease
MDHLSEYGAVKSVSLDLISSALGFAGKDGKDGSQVEALYAEGRIDELRSYCEADVLNLYGVFLRWAHLTARLDDRGLDLSQQALSQYLSSEGGLRPHLLGFLDQSPALAPAGASATLRERHMHEGVSL